MRRPNSLHFNAAGKRWHTNQFNTLTIWPKLEVYQNDYTISHLDIPPIHKDNTPPAKLIDNWYHNRHKTFDLMSSSLKRCMEGGRLKPLEPFSEKRDDGIDSGVNRPRGNDYRLS